MNVEERVQVALHDALHADADELDVDVARLHAATRRRLERPRAPRRRLVVVPVAAALVVAALVVGMLLVRLPGGDRAEGPATREARVERSFRCPDRTTADDAVRRRDDSFVPMLDGGPAEAARSLGAPRYAFDRAGGTATLRLGNADGSLASTAEFRRSGSGWELGTTVKCTGADGGVLAPDPDPLRLGRREVKPYPARRMVEDPERAVLVDDRSYFDTSGLVRHRTIWAAPCGRKLCVASGRPDSMAVDEALPGHELSDLTGTFLLPDDLVGKKQPYGLWFVHDPQREATRVVARDDRGQPVARARRLRSQGWTGQAWVVLAPRARVADVAVDWTGIGLEPFPVRER